MCVLCVLTPTYGLQAPSQAALGEMKLGLRMPPLLRDSLSILPAPSSSAFHRIQSPEPVCWVAHGLSALTLPVTFLQLTGMMVDSLFS